MAFNLVRKYDCVLKKLFHNTLKFRSALFKNNEIITDRNEIVSKRRSMFLPDMYDRNFYKKINNLKQSFPVDEVKYPGHVNEMDDPPIPNILSLQNPYTCLVNKFDMKLLQSVWDPAFNREDFITGSKQAVSRVTQLASEGNTDELHGLISRELLVELKEELVFPETGRLWAYLGLNPANLVIARPRRILFQMFDDKRFCHVDMMFVAMKWLTPYRNVNGLMYLEIFSRFRREYTLHCISDWTIVVLLITKCDVISRVPKL